MPYSPLKLKWHFREHHLTFSRLHSFISQEDHWQEINSAVKFNMNPSFSLAWWLLELDILHILWENALICVQDSFYGTVHWNVITVSEFWCAISLSFWTHAWPNSNRQKSWYKIWRFCSGGNNSVVVWVVWNCSWLAVTESFGGTYTSVICMLPWNAGNLLHHVITQITTLWKGIIKNFHGLSPRANYTERPPLVGEVSANFCG
jgi:hypothetical protein